MECQEKAGVCRVSMWGRTYTADNEVLFSSMTSLGEELLSAPIRLVGQENGAPIQWEEKRVLTLEASAEKVTLLGSQQSASFIVNTSMEVEYDGCCHMAVKIMPRGKTVQQVFGVEDVQDNPYSLEKLWLEIPLKKCHSTLFHYWPSEPYPAFDGEAIEPSSVCMSRKIPSSMHMSFKPLLWFGTEERGVCWFADSDEHWQPDDPARAIDVWDTPQEVVVRLHLIDAKVEEWRDQEGYDRNYTYMPLCFRFGLQATPVKPFPTNPYTEKILHIDCFKKILEEYSDFLKSPVVSGSEENGYDRMKRLGVTLLFLHEKWTPVQNYWKVPLEAARRTKEIVRECHKRGIKVIPYFGYELSSLSPLYEKMAETCCHKKANGEPDNGGWYRKPNQRDYVVCYNSEWADRMAQGVRELTEEYGFDGIYLDSTLLPNACGNERHGCGYTDVKGEKRDTYTVTALRAFMKKIFAYFEERGGIVNSHLSNCCNIPSLSFCHLNWDGEYIQTFVNAYGVSALPLDYLRTEYSARNFGVPYEFLAYTFNNWSFRNSLSVALVHGMLPRPNDIGEPLEIMAPIWKAIDRFPMETAVWRPYWSNGVHTGHERVLVSYYERTRSDGRRQYLVFVGNPTDQPAENVIFTLSDKVCMVYDAVQDLSLIHI